MCDLLCSFMIYIVYICFTCIVHYLSIQQHIQFQTYLSVSWSLAKGVSCCFVLRTRVKNILENKHGWKTHNLMNSLPYILVWKKEKHYSYLVGIFLRFSLTLNYTQVTNLKKKIQAAGNDWGYFKLLWMWQPYLYLRASL